MLRKHPSTTHDVDVYSVLLMSLLLGLGSPGHGTAQPTPERPADHGMGAAQPAFPAPVEPEIEEREPSVTRGSITIEGQKVDYQTTVGDLILRDDEGKAKARMTYVAYIRTGVKDPAERPVTFSFNGGPGSASVWVHLGAFGPKKALLDAEGMPVGPPPGRLVDNPYSLIDATDLVFIDPVETGWSRPAPGEDAQQFLGYSDDVAHVGDFIRLWTSRNDRWTSPKLIAGESYGTTRASGLAAYLQDVHGMYLNGICLISSVINWQTKVFNIGNDLPYALILPTYTATAWYHGLLGDRYPELEQALEDAESFALGEYASAMMLGDRLPAERRAQVVERLGQLTGLSAEYLEATDLRVEIFRFAKELLRKQGLTVGRLDSRYTGSDRDDAGERFEYDPSSAVVTGYYVSLLKDYLQRELGFRTDEPFRHSAGRRVRPWNYHEKDRVEGYNTNAYANYAETLRAAMHKNRHLRVLIMSGYYDLATPYFASDYTVDHMQLDPELREHLKVEYYRAGHMMYVRDRDHLKFRRDYLQLLQDIRSEPSSEVGRGADEEH